MLEYSALLHDIGKISVQNDILLKVGPLTEEEWRVLRSHPNIGADIVEQLKFLREAADIIRCHHERPDGTGYPRGLRGEEIPLLAHIMNVVDAVLDPVPRLHRPGLVGHGDAHHRAIRPGRPRIGTAVRTRDGDRATLSACPGG